MKNCILVVDDEKEIADLVEIYLLSENYDVIKCYDGKTAMQAIKNKKIDLAILDIMLPEISGLELCRMIRKKENYPVIMLTAKDSEVDKVTGLVNGADDYVTKPFLPLELVARVKAQLRRYECYGARQNSMVENRKDEINSSEEKTASDHAESEEKDIIICGGILLNKKAHECCLDGEEISLTPTEFTILQALCEAKGKVFSAEELFHIIWKDEYYSKSNNTITVHIRHLREKLKDTGEHPKYIKTVWGVGYKIDAR